VVGADYAYRPGVVGAVAAASCAVIVRGDRRIITDAVAYLRRTAAVLEATEKVPGFPPTPPAQKEALKRVRETRSRPARVPDDEIAALAARYVTLFRRGLRRPNSQLAAEYGLRSEQVRDRIHRARELGYLTPSKQGRAGGEPTPKLLALWNLGEWSIGPDSTPHPTVRRASEAPREPKGDSDGKTA
jgi:hypothetical protein